MYSKTCECVYPGPFAFTFVVALCVCGGGGQKKIDNDINFLRGVEEKIISLLCFWSCEEFDVSLEPNVAVVEI